MELKDVLPNEYYYCNYNDGMSALILTNKKEFRDSKGIWWHSDKLNEVKGYSPNNSFSCNKNIRLATDKEKQWINTCIKANKYVECPTIEENVLNNLQIW